MCLFFKATRILSFCIPVTNTHFGTKLTRCFPGPRDAAAPFCLLAGCGGAPPAHGGSGSWTPTGCPGSEHSCLGALRIFIHIPGPQHQFSFFFPVRFGDRRRKEAGWQCIFLVMLRWGYSREGQILSVRRAGAPAQGCPPLSSYARGCAACIPPGPAMPGRCRAARGGVGLPVPWGGRTRTQRCLLALVPAGERRSSLKQLIHFP